MSRPSSQVSSAWKARWEPSRSVRLSVSCRAHHRPRAALRPPAPAPTAWPACPAPQPHLEDVVRDDIVVSQAMQQREDVVHCHGDLGAVQLQQAPQVPVAARARHARGHCRSLQPPVHSPLIHLGRDTRNLIGLPQPHSFLYEAVT